MLSNVQWDFLKDVAQLINWAADNNYKMTGGHLKRTIDQQYLYYYGKRVIPDDKSGLKFIDGEKRSKTLNSSHLDALAIDFNIWKNGKLTYKTEDLREIGEYWKSLNPNNVWGGDWGWDAGHFGRHK